jgi:tungstate transport system substrate-binding protein
VPPTEVPPTEAPPTEAPAEPAAEASQDLILATTTSTENSGLLSAILPAFEEAANVKVNVVAVGTGQALTLGENGDADVLLVHARAREDQFMAAGHGSRREDVMYNDFVIVGPADDPADIRGKNRAARAFEEIANAQAPFVSRGDDSGTHTKEKAIWQEAGIEPAGDWYISAGQGMGAVLTMADEQAAYTLSDRATYLARTLEGIDLEILVEGDPVLFNPYGVMAVNPNKGDHIKADLANQFIDWLISVPTQEMIGEFGVEQFGSPLFTPDSQPWRDAHGAPAEAEAAGEAPVALRVTGKVQTEIGWTEEQLQGMPMVDAVVENSQGESETQTGVPMLALLEEAQVQEGATKVVLVGDDGYTAEVEMADMLACDDCVVSFRNQGGLRSAMPNLSRKTHVRGLIELRVE